MELASIENLWDPACDEPIYVPEESTEPLLDWAAIRSYWLDTTQSIERLHMRTWDLTVRPVGEEFVSALYQMHWDARMQSTGTSIGGRNRVSAILRRTPEGPRFLHYVEAPLAPMLYMQWLYERAVDYDFDA